MALSEYFIRYLQRRDVLTETDLARLRNVRTSMRTFEAGEVIVEAGESPQQSCMMVRGMSARSHAVPGRGTNRVITALHVAGDFVGLNGFLLARLEHEIVSVGPSEVEFIEHAELREITENFPHLTRLMWMSTAIDASVQRQWLVAAAVLRSSAHLAHLIAELYTRLASIGAARGHRFVLPLIQRELAGILGYSTIHINRAVRELRDRGLLRWTGNEVDILDWDGLVRLAHFTPDYLELERRHR